MDDPHWSTSAAWVDYDGDGYLDLFVCNYVDFTVKGNKRCYAPTGDLDTARRLLITPCLLACSKTLAMAGSAT